MLETYMNDNRPLYESMWVQWVHNVAHVRLNQGLLLQQHSSMAVTRGVAGGYATSVIQFQAGGDESRLRRQRYVSQITAIVRRSTKRCKQSGDRFELAGRCLSAKISVFILSLHRKRKRKRNSVGL